MHARICELLITYVLCDFVDEVCVIGEILSFLYMYELKKLMLE
jgi:hypothetical protein